MEGGSISTTNNSSLKFPLPDAYFPPVKLTPAEVECYEQRVEIIMKNALAEYNLHEAMGHRPDYGSRWTVMGSVEHLTAIRELDPSRAVENSRIFGRVDGDYNNFIDFFYSTTAQQLFAVNQFMLGHAIDAAVLCNIHTKESGKPHLYLGMKWVCLQPSSLSRKRDQCFLEYLVYTKDLQDRDVGVRVTLPLLLDECPPLPEKLKTRRVNSHTVTIVRPTNDSTDATQIFMTSEVDVYKGSSTSLTAPFKKFMTTLSSMALFADSKRISMHGMLDRGSWAPKKSRPSCGICKRKFSTTRRRQHCRLCGEVACRRCMTVRDAPLLDESTSSNPRTFQVVKTTFYEGASDAESTSWFVQDKSRARSFDNDGTFTETGGSSVVSPSPSDMNSARSAPLPESISEDGHDEASSIASKSPRRKKAPSGCDHDVQSETKTSISSEEDNEIVEPCAPMMIDLRHLRTMAGAERVVAEAEEEELRAMRESFAALDFQDVRLVNSPSRKTDDGFSGDDTPKIVELDEDEDIIEVVALQTVSSSRQIVSSPLALTPLDDDEAVEQALFASSRSNVTIDQRIAEQELLLKNLMRAANPTGYYPQSARRPAFEQ
ncbi:hypothetical protein BBJ29_001381 [Phytophthora kernoviae]|uniref:FYVE-type domain-containing protein n=1 Tax=Phytophthora kernoviae TaxID=325452 RepID=A0A3F2RZ45_9STRA|nr:hypothetical protein BBJ29_001381 [Phytophthora kernoviae]RLN67141.1 hypothetical protein BBP00_00001789 [Phytophthora kernoviae]